MVLDDIAFNFFASVLPNVSFKVLSSTLGPAPVNIQRIAPSSDSGTTHERSLHTHQHNAEGAVEIARGVSYKHQGDSDVVQKGGDENVYNDCHDHGADGKHECATCRGNWHDSYVSHRIMLNITHNTLRYLVVC